MIGLLKAVERFDPEHGSSFAAFATPTILGELRRYFRDSTWAVRVPRQLQERVLAIERGRRSAHAPAGALAEPQGDRRGDRAHRGGRARGARSRRRVRDHSPRARARLRSTGSTSRCGSPTRPRSSPISSPSGALLAASLVAHLSERERHIVELRFVRGLTQSQIAERIGVSQMQVSRLLAGRCASMRAHAERDE